MNISRIVASAFVRRVVYVLVGLLLAAISAMFAGEAQAGLYGCNFGEGCDRGEAYAAAMQHAQAVASEDPNSRTPMVMQSPFDPAYLAGWDQGSGFMQAVSGTYYYVDCPANEPWNEELKVCGLGCNLRSSLGPGAWSGVNGDMQMCQDGCTFEGGIGGGVGVCLPVVIDGTTYQHCTSWGPTGDQCSAGVGNGSLAPPDSDGDGSSDGNDGSPNNPGSGGGGSDGKPGEDGSSACGGPDQPACEADGSNSGSGKGNTSGGGGNCQTPPSSTGDAILAQIAFQTWATRCAIAGNANGGVGGGSGNGEGDGDQPDWTKGDGPAPAEDDTDYVEEQRRFGLGINADMLDQENLFGSSSCPQISFTFWKVNVNTVNFPWWCQVVEWMGYAVMLIGAWTALNILLGRSPV